tara:strand:+ start:2031 stop:2168 length:138 start_codon:yes stop_codon:yes gene_type:complete
MKKKTQTWIFESPDNGKTVYKRPFGKLEPKILIKTKTVDLKNRLN